MAKIFAHMRLIAGALALAFVVATALPAAAQQPSMVNPTADAVKEQQLLDQLHIIKGLGTIPDTKSYVLEHPAGREWREYRTVTLLWIGGVAMLGILASLPIALPIPGLTGNSAWYIFAAWFLLAAGCAMPPACWPISAGARIRIIAASSR